MGRFRANKTGLSLTVVFQGDYSVAVLLCLSVCGVQACTHTKFIRFFSVKKSRYN